MQKYSRHLTHDIASDPLGFYHYYFVALSIWIPEGLRAEN